MAAKPVTGTATVIAPIAGPPGCGRRLRRLLRLPRSLHVERETRPSRACQFARKGGEDFSVSGVIRRLAVVAGLAFRQQIQLLERLVGQLGYRMRPPEVLSAGSTCPWRSPTRSIAVDSADDRKAPGCPPGSRG